MCEQEEDEYALILPVVDADCMLRVMYASEGSNDGLLFTNQDKTIRTIKQRQTDWNLANHL